MNPRPIDVKPLDDYKLLITFQSSECKVSFAISDKSL